MRDFDGHESQGRLAEAASDLAKLSDEARTLFGGLSPAQLNWKPDPRSWSVAQCLDHLIVTHSQYFPIFEKLARGDANTSVWERLSPLSGFFGRFLIRSLHPENRKKMKTTRRAQPASSGIDARIVESFGRHQDQLIDHLRGIPADVDLRTVITSPLLGFVTYTLEDCLTILVVHVRRHLGQASRVMEAGGFPPA